MVKAFLLALVVVLGFSYGWNAAASLQCGIKPILPIGCSDAICVCDDRGNCSWQFICN